MGILFFLLAFQVQIKRDFTTHECQGHRYAVYDPGGPEKKPLLLWLHGDWYMENPPKINFQWVHLLFANGRPGYVIVLPERRMDVDWPTMYEPIGKILDEVEKKYPIDTDREYIIGISSGGTAAWSIAAKNQGRFAAIAPLGSEGNDVGIAVDLTKTPIWSFHNPDDPWTPIRYDREMVEAVRKAGGMVRLEEVAVQPGTNSAHDAWTAAIRDSHLVDWLLKQKRGEPIPPPSPINWLGIATFTLPWLALALICFWRFRYEKGLYDS